MPRLIFRWAHVLFCWFWHGVTHFCDVVLCHSTLIPCLGRAVFLDGDLFRVSPDLLLQHLHWIRELLIKMGRAKRKKKSSMVKTCGFTSSCACARSHLGFWSPLIQSIVSNVTGSGQRRPWSDWSGPVLSAYARKHVFAWRGPTDYNKKKLETSWLRNVSVQSIK